MTDIVERLRKLADRERPYGSLPDTLDEAANEISRLRSWNEEIALNARHFAEALLECEKAIEDHHAENVARCEWSGSSIAQKKALAVTSRSGVLLHTIKRIARAALEEK